MNKPELVSYLEAIDRALQHAATLYIYGSAACILLDEPDRTSLDVDVAGPYSVVDFGDLRQAAAAAGLPVNPASDYRGDHIEWIGELRLCLPKPLPKTEMLLWQGTRLSIKTVPVHQLVASKLIRYDAVDRSDIRYLLAQRKMSFAEIASAVAMLPAPFDRDPLVSENLQNLKTDMEMWSQP